VKKLRYAGVLTAVALALAGCGGQKIADDKPAAGAKECGSFNLTVSPWVGVPVAAHRRRRFAVVLDPERYAVPGRPLLEHLQEVVLVQLRQRPPEVDPQLPRAGRVDEQFVQPRS